jgi:hypothetical protein
MVWYFMLGFAGIAFGYALRIVIKILSGIEPPSPLRVTHDAPPDGPITRYVKTHYYPVDFAVTDARRTGDDGADQGQPFA